MKCAISINNKYDESLKNMYLGEDEEGVPVVLGKLDQEGNHHLHRVHQGGQGD